MKEMTYLVAGEFRAADLDEAKRIAEWLFEQEGFVVSIEPIRPAPTERDLNEAWGV